MYITTQEILKLDEVIHKINSFSDETERDKYLQSAVEDADMFISALKALNKGKLVRSNRNKNCIKSNRDKNCTKKHNDYTKEEIIKIFRENNLDDIANRYTKQDLTDMYLTFYSSKPLTKWDKMKIAQNIYHYIYTMNRAKALLG